MSSPEEVGCLLPQQSGVHYPVAALLYASGLRLMEALRLRTRDVAFDRHQLTMRDGKGENDRVTVLPSALREPFARQLPQAKLWHEEDLAAGFGRVYLPYALKGRRWRTASSTRRAKA